MRRILIFGNSGSGKSTLARKLAEAENLAHLDLDTFAWLPTSPPRRLPLDRARGVIEQFLADNQGWIVEGCYTDLLEIAAGHATEIIYLNLPIEQCVLNAKRRPWEPHKYASKQLQDANLEMLIDWIRQYAQRTDEFSQAAHLRFYEQFQGIKSMRRNNVERGTHDPAGESQ